MVVFDQLISKQAYPMSSHVHLFTAPERKQNWLRITIYYYFKIIIYYYHYCLNEPDDVFEVYIIWSRHVSDEPSSIVSCTK